MNSLFTFKFESTGIDIEFLTFNIPYAGLYNYFVEWVELSARS